MKNFNFNPQCYKLCFDADLCDVGIVFDKLSNIGDVFCDKNYIYVFSDIDDLKKTITDILYQFGIDNLYLERILCNKQENQDTPLAVWYKESYERKFIEAFNEQYEKEINIADENVKKVIDYLDS